MNLKKNKKHIRIALQIVALFVSFSSFAQDQQSFRHHEEIDLGGGLKVEILTCSGEGPTEVCDCIYFTDKRQNGTRMKQNANTIKEQQRAAEIAKNINKPLQLPKAANNNVAATRPDKALPSSIIPKPHLPASKPAPTLEDAVKRADSLAKASSQKLQEINLKTSLEEDSSEMDKVYIPKVTATGGTRLESSAPKANTGKITLTDTAAVVKEMPEKTAVTANIPNTNIPDDTKSAAILKDYLKDTAAIVSSSNNNKTSDVVNTSPIIQKDTSVSVATLLKVDTVPVSTANVSPAKETLKDTLVINKLSPADINADTAEHNWVKQYQNVKSNNPEQPAIKATSEEEEKHIDSSVAVNLAAMRVALQAQLRTKDSIAAITHAKQLKELQNDKLKKTESPVKTAMNAKPSAAVNISSKKLKEKQLANVASKDSSKTGSNNISSGKKKISNNPIAALQTSANPAITNDSTSTAANATISGNVSVKENNEVLKSKMSVAPNVSVVGKNAEVKLKGDWTKATIIDKESEYLYKVHYLGKSASEDEWVSVTQIRNIDTAIRTVKPATTVKVVNVNCSFTAPAPPVNDADKFSERLAKRKIYESYISSGKDENNGKKLGVTFLSMKAEDPYINSVTISATNNLEVKLASAPPGAMIYPVTTQYKLCEQVLGKTSSKTYETNYACFRNKQGSWACVDLK